MSIAKKDYYQAIDKDGYFEPAHSKNYIIELENQVNELLEFIKESDFYCGQVEQCINDTTGDYRDLDCSDNFEICKKRYELLKKYNRL